MTNTYDEKARLGWHDYVQRAIVVHGHVDPSPAGSKPLECELCYRLAAALAACAREGEKPLVTALKNLCDKLDKVVEDTKGLFVMAYAHGQMYQGANWAEEYNAAREALQHVALADQAAGGKERVLGATSAAKDGEAT